MKKTCTKCGATKEAGEFYKASRQQSGLRPECKACDDARPRRGEYRQTDEYKAQQRRRVRRVNMKTYQQAYRARLKARVIAAYGGVCACCGESIPEFLTIDHIHGGGDAHVKSIGGASKLYRWLELNGFPKDAFQLLCFNCNCAKGHFGRCPHETRKEAQAEAA